MKKNISAIIFSLTVMLIMSLLCISATAEFEYTETDTIKIVNGVVYEKFEEDGIPQYYVRALATSFSKGQELTDVELLSEIDGYPVTRIDLVPYYVNPPYRADYPNIKEITIPESVTRIDIGGLSGLELLVIPETVTELGYKTFYHLESIEKLVIPYSITEIPDYAFYCCKSLKEVIFENKITKVGAHAFAYCENLKSFDASAVTEIGKGAFNGCKSLKEVTLNDSVKNLNENVFLECENLEKINLENIQYIGSWAFSGCKNLKNVTFSENLEMIDVGAFRKSGLEAVTIPAKTKLSSTKMEAIGGYFSGCENLKTVIFEDRAEKDKIFYVYEFTFAYCTSLEKIVLPKNVEKIVVCHGAFLNCENLKSFDFSNVISIYDKAFENCKNLTKVNFSDELEVIGCHAFAGTGIKTVTIPSKTELDCELSADGDHDDEFPYEDRSGQFRDCKNLKTVVFEDKEKSKLYIPYYTFTNCTSLKKVYLPEDIKITIGMRAFKNCTSLTKVYGSENIVEIGDAAFSYCKSLKEITLGKNLKTVGEKAFLGCTKLARVNLESTKAAPTFGRKAFSATADGIKFVADKAIAKKVKTNLKNTATKNAKVYSVSYSKV